VPYHLYWISINKLFRDELCRDTELKFVGIEENCRTKHNLEGAIGSYLMQYGEAT
jgi:hypothetical protein